MIVDWRDGRYLYEYQCSSSSVGCVAGVMSEDECEWNGNKRKYRLIFLFSLISFFQDCGGGALGGLSRRWTDCQGLDRNGERIESSLVVSKHECSLLESGKGMLKAIAGVATHARPLSGVLSDVF